MTQEEKDWAPKLKILHGTYSQLPNELNLKTYWKLAKLQVYKDELAACTGKYLKTY